MKEFLGRYIILFILVISYIHARVNLGFSTSESLQCVSSLTLIGILHALMIMLDEKHSIN